MSNIVDYFSENRYHPSYHIGDRVFGHWKKIPFIGSVGNDTLVSEIDGPRVSVFLDLPFKYEGKIYNIVIVNPGDIKLLVNY